MTYEEFFQLQGFLDAWDWWINMFGEQLPNIPVEEEEYSEFYHGDYADNQQ